MARSPSIPRVVHLKIPVHSFRNLHSPLNDSGVFRYWAIAPLATLPAMLKDWDTVNPREPSVHGYVAKRIRDTLVSNPLWFELFNRGIVVTAKSVAYDNKTNEVLVDLSDADLHGVLDGLHTLRNIAEVVKGLKENEGDVKGSITIEFTTGLTVDQVTDFSDARNTSLQVKSKSLADQAGKFESLKQALRKSGINPDDISWHENDPGVMDVRELVALVSLFNQKRWNATEHPLQAYYGKEVTLKYFLDRIENEPDEFEKIYPLVGDIIRLPEWVRHYVPEQQHEFFKSKFGNITAVHLLDGLETLPFTGLQTQYAMPDAYVYPLVASFRALTVVGPSGYKWTASPEKAIKDGVASEMFREGIFPTIQTLRNAMAVGKQPSVWGHCFVKGAMYAMMHKA